MPEPFSVETQSILADETPLALRMKQTQRDLSLLTLKCFWDPKTYSEEIVARVKGPKGGISIECFLGFAYLLPIYIIGVKAANTYIRTVPDWTSDRISICFGLAVLLFTIIPRIMMASVRSSPNYPPTRSLAAYYMLYCGMTVAWLGKVPTDEYLTCVVGIICMWSLPNAMLKMEMKAQDESTNYYQFDISAMMNCYFGLFGGMGLRPTIQYQGGIWSNTLIVEMVICFLGPMSMFLLVMCFPQINRIVPPYIDRSFLPFSVVPCVFIIFMYVIPMPSSSNSSEGDIDSIWIRERKITTLVYLLMIIVMNLPIGRVQRIVDPALFLFGLTLILCDVIRMRAEQ